MPVAVWSGSALAWEEELTALKKLKNRLAPVFRRSDVAASAGAFIDGLLSGISRKTGWQMAEQAGLSRPYRMQPLLGRSSRDAEALRDRVRREAVASLGDPSAVLVVDETGFLKKGEHSVGVARHYSGTAGRIENCQIGVFLAYASRFGQALIDRRLYLPDAWAGDQERRRRVQFPEAVAFATKPRIACELIAAALDAGVPCAWVLADALCGSDSRLRRRCNDSAPSILKPELLEKLRERLSQPPVDGGVWIRRAVLPHQDRMASHHGPHRQGLTASRGGFAV